MKKALIAISCIATVGLVASNANAQCAFNGPAKAKGLKTSMTRYFAGCGNSITFAVPNDMTMTGTPSCSAPFANSGFTFGAKGSCDVKTSQKIESDCSQAGAVGSCANVKVNGKCKDITIAGGSTQINGPTGGGAWRLATLSRATLDDQLGGDMTVIDFPLSFAFDEPKKGGIKVKSDSNTALEALLGPGSAIPGCTSIQVLSAEVTDPTGSVFATMGTSTR